MPLICIAYHLENKLIIIIIIIIVGRVVPVALKSEFDLKHFLYDLKCF